MTKTSKKQNMDKMVKIYKDYISIDSAKAMNKRKITLSEYRTFPYLFKDIQKYGSCSTFIKGLADYFEKFGFNVQTEDDVSFFITL